MTAHALAQKIETARTALRAALADGKDSTAAQAELGSLRAQMAALDPEDRAALWQADAPMACLPVRLETAFVGDTLCVRVYPDTIHIDDHDPRVPGTDHATARAVAETVQTAPERRAELHRWMDDLMGAPRAARARAAVARNEAPRPDTLPDRPVVAGALPDRWHLDLTWPGGTLSQDFPKLVAEPLPLGPSLLDQSGVLGDGALDRLWAGGKTGPNGIAWMVDFDTALAMGMATRLSLTDPGSADLRAHLARGGAIDTVTVHGVRWTTAAAGQAQLTDLMHGHIAQRALRTLPQGSATVNDGPHRTPGPPEQMGGANLDRLVRALGLKPGTFDLAGDTTHDEDEVARAMNHALWPGTGGLWTQAILGLDAQASAGLRRMFCDRLRGRGPLSSLQVGQEPYGVLPLTVAGRGPAGTSASSDARDAKLAERVEAVIGRLPPGQLAIGAPATEAEWLENMAHVPHPAVVAASAWSMQRRLINPRTTTALATLGLDPDSSPARDALGTLPEAAIVPPLPLSRWDKRLPPAQRTDRTERDLLDAHPITLRTLFDLTPRDRWPVKPWREMPVVRDIHLLSSGEWSFDREEPGDPLLYTLLRHALFTHLTDVMRAVLRTEGQDVPPLVDVAQGPGALPLLDAFLDHTGLDPDELTVPLGKELQDRLGLPKHLAEADSDLEAALGVLAKHPGPRLELAMREHLGLISARPDAWISALDAAQLDRLRDAQNGVLVAGAGRVFGLRPDPDPVEAGEYVLGRSPAHALTGAILRDGSRRRRQDGGQEGAFALDLRSSRVRAALDVLRKMRAGRSLGEVLGTKVEAMLRQSIANPATLTDTLTALRRAAPLREGLIGEDAGQDLATVETCDGAKLVDAWDAGTGGIIPDAARAAVSALADTVDAIADLMLAEGVHAVAAATPERAGAVLDAVSRGATPPESFAVAETPRAGRGLDVKVVLTGAADPVPQAADAPTAADMAAQRGVALGPLSDALAQLVGPLDRYGLWHVAPGGARTWRGLEETGLDAAALVLSASTGRTPAHALVEAVLAPDGAVDKTAPGPKDQPEFAATALMLGRLNRMITEARGLQSTDLDLPAADGSEDHLQDRAAHVLATARALQAQLTAAQDPQDRRRALRAAALFGRADAAPGIAAPEGDLATLVQSTAAQLGADIASAEAAADAASGLRALLGATLPIVPCLDSAAAQTLKTRINAANARGLAPRALRRWAAEAATVRPRLAAGLDAIEAAELLRDATLLTLCPTQNGDDATWAAMAAPAPGSTVTHAAAILGPLPTGDALGGLVLDDWSEVLPDAEITAGLAIEAPRPNSRAPQIILLAMTDSRWTADAGHLALDRAFALARLRATSPTGLGNDLGALPPVLSFQDPTP